MRAKQYDDAVRKIVENALRDLPLDEVWVTLLSYMSRVSDMMLEGTDDERDAATLIRVRFYLDGLHGRPRPTEEEAQRLWQDLTAKVSGASKRAQPAIN